MQSKIPTIKQAPFSPINDLIEEYGALDMAVKKNDPPCPEALLELAHKYLKQGATDISPLEGILPLRETISKMHARKSDYVYDPKTEVTVSVSRNQAAFTVISALIREGDEVLIVEPTSTLYAPAITFNGGRPIYVKPAAPNFQIDWNEVRMLINAKTRMIIIDSPNNPSGKVMSEDDMLQLQRLINSTNIFVMSDETFSDVVFDETKHYSVASFEKLRARSFIISALGAPLNINSWGISYCLAPELLTAEYRKMQQVQLLSVNTPMQYAVAEFLEEYNNLDNLYTIFQGKRNYFNRLMANSLYTVIPSQGGCFELLDYSKISDEDDVTFSRRLLVDHGIATIPLSAFYHENTKHQMLQVCIAKENHELEKAAEILLSVPSVVVESFRS
ncbi:MAG: aminotransferase class I/II-fold pyridoxal phosphate-dependent enzyme [Mangrovibacterium sp.]